MCGRFTLTLDPAQLREAFPWLFIPENIPPRFNIAPTQPVAVVPNTGDNRVQFFTWGLLPSWSKDPAISNRLINARAETLAEKPSFRTAFRRRRCLILADGFFEWRQDIDQKRKIPYYVFMKSRQPFAFAGLWDIWSSQDGSEIRSCTIITTTPNEIMQAIHNRMPVILSPGDYPLWLDPQESKPERFKALLSPYPAAEMDAHPVSTFVNAPQNDSPECILPV